MKTQRNMTSVCLALGALLALAGARAEVALSISARDNHSDLEPTQINRVDCENPADLFELAYSVSGETTSGRELYLYLGADCDTSDGCRLFATITDLSSGTLELSASDLVDGANATTVNCNATEGTTEIWLGLLENDSTTSREEGVWAAPIEITFDLSAPVAPTDLTATFGEQAATVGWTDDSGVDEVGGYRVVCWPAPGGAATSALTAADGGADSETLSETASESETGTGVDTDTGPVLDTDTDIGSDTTSGGEASCGAAGGFRAGDVVDPSWFCSGTLGPTSRSKKISNLVNGVEYRFGVVAVDDFLNSSVVSSTDCATPAEVTDFFESYKNSGGHAGGFCFVATAAYGSYDHPVVRALRSFRDRFLIALPGGHALVDAYYAAGPTLAARLDTESERTAARGVLAWCAGLGQLLVRLGAHPFLALLSISLVFGLALGAAITRRGRHS